MFAANSVKRFLGRACAAVGYVIKSLPDTLLNVGAGGNVEQALIRFGVLDDGLGLALNGKHYGPLAFLELLHEVAGATAEGRQRLNVFGDIEHETSLL
jgi:hypothetical protein